MRNIYKDIVKKRTKVKVLVSYYSKLRLKKEETLFNFQDKAIDDVIEFKYDKEKIKRHLYLVFRERGYSDVSIISIYIKKWWQIWKF